jgi:hypothetical protein
MRVKSSIISNALGTLAGMELRCVCSPPTLSDCTVSRFISAIHTALCYETRSSVKVTPNLLFKTLQAKEA